MSVTTTSDWQAAVQRIRNTAGWIAKAFAAIAALLIGTGPLLVRVSDLTPGPLAVAAAAGATVGLLGLGLVIYWATQVMLPETTDLADLLAARQGPLAELRRHVETDIGRSVYLDRNVDTVAALVAEIESTRRTVAQLGRLAEQAVAFEAQAPPPDPQTLPAALSDPAARASIATIYAGEKTRLNDLNARAADLVRQGVYVEVRGTFLRARQGMLVGGALAAAGVAVYVAAFGITDEAKKESVPVPVAVEMLTWNATSEGARPVTEVRTALGLGATNCDALPVVVRGGKGTPEDPWQLSTMRDGRCTAPPRSFAVDNRYAAVTSEPETTYSLNEPPDPAAPWVHGALGLLTGGAVAGAMWLLRPRRMKQSLSPAAPTVGS